MVSSPLEIRGKDPLTEFAGWNRLDVNENANRYQGPSSFFAWLLDKYMERDALSLLPGHILKAHLDGTIYIHKLPHSVYIPYCTGHSIARLLKKGLRTITIVSRPARHFDTFVDHVANFLITMQHYFTGAQALSSVEWYSGPFIRNDKPNYKQVKQQVQRLLYNLNYPTRIGMQTCFSNFTIVMDAPRKMLEGDRAVYGGQEVEPLGAYEEEAKTFLKALVELYYEGDSVGQPFTFPIPTLMVTAKWLWEDPEIHEAVFKTAAKRGSFYWLNTRMVDPDGAYAMCLHKDELIIFKHNGKIGVTTIGELFREFSGTVEARDVDGAEWYSVNGDVEVLAYNCDTGVLSWRRVKRFLVKRAKRAVRIELADGREFTVTHDHPLLIKRRDGNEARLVKASELLKRKVRTEHGTLQYQLPVVLSEVQTSDNYVKLTSKADNVEVVVDEAFGYFLGLYYGDGTLIRNSWYAKKVSEELTRDGYYLAGLQFSVGSDEGEVINYVADYGARLGCSVRVWQDPRWASVTYIALGNARLARLLYDNGVGPYSDERGIPWFIWSSPPSVRRAFIKGLLDSDGYYRRCYWELHIKNKRLAQELLLLASISGVSAYFRENKDGSVVVYFPAPQGKVDENVEFSWKHRRRTGDVVWVSIINVEEVEYPSGELFIDIELEEDHYFVHSGGVITHNCCRISIDKHELLHAFNNSKFRLGLKRDLEDARERYWKTMERQRFGGLWAMPDITGSVNVVDVNLPRLALEARREESRFWELYDETLKLVREACNWFRSRYVSIMKNYPNFYAMILEYMPEFPAFHFNTIGLIGLPEAAAILMQEPKLWLDGSRSDWLRAAELMRKIVEYTTETARKWMSEEGVPWNVEEVPGESASPKLAMLDLKRHPELAEYLPDPENPVYATSVAPYYAPMELPDRVEVEQRVQKYFTGGVMMHVFLGEEAEPEALASLTKKLLQTELVYWSYTPAVVHCNTCEKTFTGLYTKCPSCGSENVDIWSRIIGYYRPLRNWNPQRRREFWTRKHHLLPA